MRKTFPSQAIFPSEKPAQLPAMSLDDRLRWVMEQRGWSMSYWCNQAQLKERTTLEKYFKRVQKSETASMRVDILVPLAKAAGVSVEWLATGEGVPVWTPTLESDPLYPSRAQAIQVAKIWLYEPEAIERVRARDDFARDPGPDVWNAPSQGRARARPE